MTQVPEWEIALADWLGLIPDLTAYSNYDRRMFTAFATKTFYRDSDDYDFDSDEDMDVEEEIRVQGARLATGGMYADPPDVCLHNAALVNAVRKHVGMKGQHTRWWGDVDKSAINRYEALYIAALENPEYTDYINNGVYDLEHIKHCLANDIDAAMSAVLV